MDAILKLKIYFLESGCISECLGDQFRLYNSKNWMVLIETFILLFVCIWAATWQNRQSDCVPSEDSDQPGHLPSLIRVFVFRMKKAWVLSYPLSASKDSDHTGLIPRLIWVFPWRTVTLVLSCRGSSIKTVIVEISVKKKIVQTLKRSCSLLNCFVNCFHRKTIQKLKLLRLYLC